VELGVFVAKFSNSNLKLGVICYKWSKTAIGMA
jgi:hypothetical protein